ncbi:hypothetical protein OEV98_13130 [Caldibacillus lycopersici]|uniref:Uncharacterized protein n=1 Tax=Perspicuibacillus lycopersici TaxID=1325689 RepID=A0AAE3IU63_9BACI|nr:hypothetical protein [Perspicuibacillus lycopersici]MCU9614482.1 hypothetical protein [Perspicuibacillus lycopersici]
MEHDFEEESYREEVSKGNRVIYSNEILKREGIKRKWSMILRKNPLEREYQPETE